MNTRIAYSSTHGAAAVAAHLSAFGALGGAFYFTRMNFLERGFTRVQIAKAKGTEFPCDGRTDYVTLSDEKIAAFTRRMDEDRTETTGDAGDGD